MRNGGLLLPSAYPLQSFLLSVSQHQQQCQWPPSPFPPKHMTFNFITCINPSLFRPQFHARSRRWDSNAENFRTQNFEFNPYQDNDGDDEDDGESWIEVLEEFIDGVWIFKVFRSYGWTLPVIISSLLLTTGLKAFLLALAIPLGQSALSLAFQKVWERTHYKPKRKGKARKKPRDTAAYNSDLNKKKEERQRSGKDKMGYQTWVAGNDVPADKSTQYSPSFGGWEELDRDRDTQFKKSAQTADGKQKTLKSKLSRREGRSDTPLLLRLLIAVFPFLGSWTKMI